jgi:hypothetical protein
MHYIQFLRKDVNENPKLTKKIARLDLLEKKLEEGI